MRNLALGAIACAGAAVLLWVVMPLMHNPPAPPPALEVVTSAHDVAIYGDEKFGKIVNDALDLLKRKAPEDYQFVIDQVREFRLDPRSGTHVENGRCRVDLSMVTVGGSITWTASVLVHEANHNKIYREYIAANGQPTEDPYGGAEEELACNALQLKTLERLNAPQYEIDHLRKQDGNHFDMDGDGDHDWDDYRLRDW